MGLASVGRFDLSDFFVAVACSRKDRFCLLVDVDLVVRYLEKLSSLWWGRRANMMTRQQSSSRVNVLVRLPCQIPQNYK